MRFTQVLAIFASVASVAYANDDDVEGTTTLTSTTTATITVTKCNPSVTNCPARETSAMYPLSNSTSLYMPTGTGPVTVVVAPTSTSTMVVIASTTASTTPSTVPTAGSANLFVQGSVLLGALGLGLVAAL